ncbi:CpaD family pilus assembly lipoprotein [Sphingomonas sp. PAMC 26617]|uniref:CpaD family pilus assembly lipoprotein n=1 Tax=Sphingomonas sp. PAMC 26617 TaxID=1112216 RepID=UPI000289D622|nr:CpaD family pilus assembly lipoprotein [Sphingomonas sp. PAMC 26617]
MITDTRPRALAAALLPALLPALLLTGCAGTKNRGLESVHQPVVSRSSYALDVTTTPDGLAPGERQRLASWMASLRLGYGDTVAIEDPGSYGPGGYGDTVAIEDPGSYGPGGYGDTVRDVVAAETARYGLMVTGDTPLTTSPVQPGTARIVISRMTATVPGCPDFSRVRSPEFESNTSSNQGCAINSNIAAMVASPADLVRGQTGHAITDQATAGRAIDLYRKAAPTGGGGTIIKAESSGGGSK